MRGGSGGGSTFISISNSLILQNKLEILVPIDEADLTTILGAMEACRVHRKAGVVVEIDG